MDAILDREFQYHTYIRERIKTEFPDVDEETLADTLEGLTSLNDMLAAIIRSQQEDRVLAQALRARIADMQERQGRIEARADKKRELAASVMERAQVVKLTEPDFTASLRQAPRKLVVVNEVEIPMDYWRPQPPKLDRQLLIQDLKEDKVIPGAQLDNGGMSLAVRVK